MKKILLYLFLVLFLSGCGVMQYQQWQDQREEYFQSYSNRSLSPEIRQAIFSHKVILGMTKKQVTLSIGPPSEINRTVGNWGVREQWVYRSARIYEMFNPMAYDQNRKPIYLYFEKDKLVSWQD